ncbi:MAG TPA: sn-glycerol-3-phosphate ABC transporter ATP-binding protein UgpC [Gaiellales bacterium]|nr:sn-glycerol-3-phosphate ABC transporter ATP-binding protein UgpC [Gaiellales bacterium]
MAEISFDQVTKVYPDGTEAVSAVDLEIEDGALMVLVGPSGCGKTTLLRMVAGLEEITEGEIRIGDRVINDVEPKNRDLAMVFQNYALYPHMTCYDNIAFGLKLRRMPKREIDRRVRDTAHALGLDEQLRKKPRSLSGGQRQRVAMGRAIVREPKAFLMDEPLSNLDAKLRVEMRTEISRIQQDLETTMIYVTHDQTEAMTMGDKVAVMKRGLLQQVAEPQELYDNPANLFVAGFIGSPAMNMVQATLVGENGTTGVEFGGLRLDLQNATLDERPVLRDYVGRKLAIGVRPEDIEDPEYLPPGAPDARIPVMVEVREAMGPEIFAHFTVDAPPVLTEDTRDLAADRGLNSEELEGQAESGSAKFVARLNPRTSAVRGKAMELAIDVRRLQFFDLETGKAI